MNQNGNLFEATNKYGSFNLHHFERTHQESFLSH